MTVSQGVWDALTVSYQDGFENADYEVETSLYSERVDTSLASDQKLCNSFKQAKDNWRTYAIRGTRQDATSATQTLKAETSRLQQYKELATSCNPTTSDDLQKLMLRASNQTNAEANFLTTEDFVTDLPMRLQTLWRSNQTNLRFHFKSYEQYTYHQSVTVADKEKEIEMWESTWATYHLVKMHEEYSKCLNSLDAMFEAPTQGELEKAETQSFAESYKRAKVLMDFLGRLGRRVHEANVAKEPSKDREKFEVIEAKPDDSGSIYEQ